MKLARSILAGAAVLAVTQAAQAAPPNVQGQYAVMIHVLCNARFSAPTATFKRDPSGVGSAVTGINQQQTGELSVGVGFMTFPATAGTSGNASLRLNFVGGDVLRVNNNGSPFGTNAQNSSGTFLIQDVSPPGAPNTVYRFTFDENGAGAPPAMVFTMSYGNAGGNLARTLYLVHREPDGNCLNAVSATKR